MGLHSAAMKKKVNIRNSSANEVRIRDGERTMVIFMVFARRDFNISLDNCHNSYLKWTIWVEKAIFRPLEITSCWDNSAEPS